MIEQQLFIASDHAGFQLKNHLVEYFLHHHINVKDFGTHSNESTDYPDYAHIVGTSISENPNQLAILICGSGNGIAMAANKHPHVRAALCWTPQIAELAKQHNNANVLCLPARFVTTVEAEAIVEAFLNTTFEGGRHQKRVEKINL